jgi:hypothetical protein
MSELTESDFAVLGEKVDIAVNKMDRRRADGGWHLKKEVNLSIIISVIGVAVAGVTAYSDLKRDLALMQADIAGLHQSDAETRENLKESVIRFNTAIDKIDMKLDRLIEKKQ